jgi:hypothetical protein
MTWTLAQHSTDEGTQIQVLEAGGRVLSVAQILLLWQVSSFAAWFSQALLSLPPSASVGAIFFECRPVTGPDLASQAFEAMVLPARELVGLAPEPQAFATHWAKALASSVVTFANLGNDAILLAPAPQPPSSEFSHLVPFLRTAGESQVVEFWRQTAVAFTKRATERARQPTWLSTSGLGVSWLHMRIDNRPKYYRWAPFISPSACLRGEN